MLNAHFKMQNKMKIIIVEQKQNNKCVGQSTETKQNKTIYKKKWNQNMEKLVKMSNVVLSFGAFFFVWKNRHNLCFLLFWVPPNKICRFSCAFSCSFIFCVCWMSLLWCFLLFSSVFWCFDHFFFFAVVILSCVERGFKEEKKNGSASDSMCKRT